MVALESASAALGFKAPAFSLKGTDGKIHTLESVRGKTGLLVMFICNHCPYVKAQLERIVRDARELKAHGVESVAIMSNDAENYADDSFENMQKLATEMSFLFPYVIDETQEVARAYGAVCTPEFYGFNAQLELQYRGRLDESWSKTVANPKRELFEAMVQIAKSGQGPKDQSHSIGCSIKWKQGSRRPLTAHA